MTCSGKEKENSSRPCCFRNRARSSSVVNSGGFCGYHFRRMFIYYRLKTAPGIKTLCRYNETYVITNHVISVKKCTEMMLSWQGPRDIYLIARFMLYPDSLYQGTTCTCMRRIRIKKSHTFCIPMVQCTFVPAICRRITGDRLRGKGAKVLRYDLVARTAVLCRIHIVSASPLWPALHYTDY